MRVGEAVSAELRGALAAAALLSRLPLDRGNGSGAAEVARGSWAFPLVGAALGVAIAIIAILGERLLTPLAAASLAVCAGVLVTGALHLDGLADCADGLGGRTPDHALAIMRDHALGSYGAAALSLDLILRVALLAGLLTRPASVVAALAVAGAVARAAVLPVAALLPYARIGHGLGAALTGTGGSRCLSAIAIAIVLAFAILGVNGLLVLATSTLATVLAVVFARRRFGGFTGDVLGATVELVELVALATVLAVA
jgi:adenosylcobinamide-GDP ribazoletransferase